RKSFLARPKAGEIAAASGAAIRRRADAQQQARPFWRAIVLFAPRGQVLAIAAWTPRIFPGAASPNAGLPASPAAPAAERINAENTLQNFDQVLPVRHPDVARAALRTGQLHVRDLTNIQDLCNRDRLVILGGGC